MKQSDDTLRLLVAVSHHVKISALQFRSHSSQTIIILAFSIPAVFPTHFQAFPSIKLVDFQTFLLYIIDYEIFKSVSNEINYVREFCKQQLKNIQKIRALEQISRYFLPAENS